MSPVPSAILVTLMALWGLFAVQQRVQATRHGYMVQHLEEERRLLLNENRRLNCEIAALTRPDRIAAEVRRLGLDLVDPVALSRPDAETRTQSRATPAGVTPKQSHAAN